MKSDNIEEIVKLDGTDKKILKIINKDARTPYRQISRDLDISVGTVHNRIDKLVKTEVIKKFTSIMNHEKLGYNLTTIIGVKLKNGQLDSWENSKYSPNIIGIYEVTGEYDALLITKFRDTHELDAFIKDLLKEPGIYKTCTQMVLNIIKEDLGSAEML
ncbi:Lrp/AsnC family transcriptional regulator [Methanobrevibacter filiformis]|uniref:HTH-type transcriptional regulator LrpC n=1 Tax=Methanobrevibacter filiformis TaxID=55758 RepID=A0A166BQR8_9EURY|nr:Lrp/AsnC family transcriptional regulator [Methanobrevibacter filiformis]KZX13692.1 HTH-type transcriptional regulator LrpC [Methanobrevibacter filiformis]